MNVGYRRVVGMAIVILAGFVTAAGAQPVYMPLHRFASGVDDGLSPLDANVVADASGNLYGTTFMGGIGWGTVYTIRNDGSDFRVIHPFNPNADLLHESEGGLPNGTLLLVGDTLYGTAALYGRFGWGTVFKVGTDGSSFEVLHAFAGPDGSQPVGSLVMGPNQTLYGTTWSGGTSDLGTVFCVSVSPQGTSCPQATRFSVLHSFGGAAADDGAKPFGLVLNGTTLYGTTEMGGTSDVGTVFSISTGGAAYSVMHRFDGEVGAYPLGGLVHDANGLLYGTTTGPRGTVFKIGPSGDGFTVLKEFGNELTDGNQPRGQLALYGNNTLYGATMFGGLYGGGTVFTLQTDGSNFSFVHHFADRVDGLYPRASVIVDNTGALYGTTQSGGSADPNDPDHDGVLFKLTGIIVETMPPSVSCAPPPIAGWVSTDVLVPCTASDSGSGLANPADASFSLSTHVFPDTETVLAETDRRSICDVAGNCVPAGPYGPFMIDRRPPTVFIDDPDDGAVFMLGAVVAASYTCEDGEGSGVASCTGSVPSGSPIDTATAGPKTFTINASDRVGNSSSLTVNYTVQAPLTPSAITVVSQPNPSVSGQSVTITATVTGSTPTGTVTFYVDGFPEPGSFSLQATSPTTATASTSVVLSTGSHDLSARYFGDAFNTPSVSLALSHQVLIDDSSGTATKAMATNWPDDLKGGFSQSSEAALGSGGPFADVRAHLFLDTGPNTTLVGGQVGLGNASVAGDAAAARGVTYRTYTNTTNEPLLQARADVSGMFLGSAGRVIATVYVFDASAFLSTVRNSGKPLPEFLLGTPADTLASYASATQGTLSLANLFPTTALLGSASRILLPSNYIESSKVRVETTFPVAPGQTVIYVSDFIAYDASPGTLLSFGQLLDVGRPEIAYSVSSSPASLALLRSSAKSSTITLRSTNGVSERVQLAGAWIGAAPAGVTFTISPANVTVPASTISGALVTLNVAASAAAEAGLFTLRQTATSASGVTRSIDILVLVSQTFAAPTCGCSKTGPFEDPRVVGLVPQSSLATVTVSANRLTLTRNSDSRAIVSDVDHVSAFGFSPNGKYFVLITSQSTLTGPVPSLTLYSVPAAHAVGAASSMTNPLSWGFSPDADNRFFLVTSSESLPTYVDVHIYDTQTETRVMQTPLSNYSSTGQPPEWTDEKDVEANDHSANDNDKVGGWGFSPDGNTFVLSYKTRPDSYDLIVLNLARSLPVIGETRSDVASFWQFSPCGDLFMLVSQRGPNPATSDTVDFFLTSKGIVYEEVNLDPASGAPSATAAVAANSTFEIQLTGMSRASIESPQCSTSVTIHSPANIVLVDEFGRQTGFDRLTGGVLNEIPGGTYTGVGSEPQTVTVPYAREAYLLIAYGLDSLTSPAPYTLTFATIDAAGDAFDQADVSAIAFRGSVDRFAFATGDGPITPTRTDPADTVPPEIHCSGADGEWHASDVVLVCSVGDSQSGLANPADASVSLSTHVATGTESGNASTDSRQVCDNAGNCASAGPISGNKVDKKGPSIVITSPNGTYAVGQTVPAAYSCADTGSGIATCAGTVPNGANINTVSEGTKNFAVTATDAVGNRTDATVTYGVVMKGAADQIRDLIALVKSFGLSSGITNNLVSKLQSALDLVTSGKSGACGKLKDFIDAVNAQLGKGITQTQAAALTESATRIKAVLGCR